MKLLKTIYFVLCFNLVSAQTYKTVELIKETKYLNGGARAFVGGVSRVAIPVVLPNNTKSWYYSFSTSSNESGTQMLNLAVQIGAAITSGPLSSQLASEIKVPLGSGSIDVWVIPQESRNSFISKNDENVRYYQDMSETNTRQAVKQISEVLDGTVYLGLRNPSAINGISVTIEVVAIVEVEQTKNGWTKSQKEKLYNVLKKSSQSMLNVSVSEKEAWIVCLLNKITVKYSSEVLYGFAQYERNQALSPIIKDCQDELKLTPRGN